MGKRKKKRSIHKKRRRRRRRTKSSSLPKPKSSFPLDLAPEILSRLPGKSVVRFRCVSKFWSSITTEPYFINSFETQSSAKPSLLLFFKKRDKLFVFSFPQHNSGSNDSQPVVSYQMTYPKYCAFSPTESVHGLVCFRKKANPIIWNPTMRQFLTLPKPEKSWKRVTVFLGYDPIDRKHKVVCMPCSKTCDECRVLTLGSAQESWRIIKFKTHRPFAESCGRCINGVLYYKARLDHPNVGILMSFDVRSEKFDIVELPPGNFGCMLIPYEGRLGCVINNNTLLVLEDARKHKWSCKHSITHLDVYNDQSLETIFKLSGITHAGEFIYVPSKFHTSFYIIYLDPKRNSIRKVEFKGITDDQFRRANELGDFFLCPLQTFPNHVQSLISL